MECRRFPELFDVMGALFRFLGDDGGYDERRLVDDLLAAHRAAGQGDCHALTQMLQAAPYLADGRDAEGRLPIDYAEPKCAALIHQLRSGCR